MRHQKQKPYECFPTVLGMLLDRKASSVIGEILGAELSKQSWNYLISNGHTVNYLKLESRIESFLSKYCAWLTIKAFKSIECTNELDSGTLNLTGKGILVTRRNKQGHIVAFEDNEIFDSSMASSCSWTSYRDKLKQEDRGIYYMVKQ